MMLYSMFNTWLFRQAKIVEHGPVVLGIYKIENPVQSFLLSFIMLTLIQDSIH